ncbi:sigma 54-interacting transcriptional regulator [Irregularibacter muris]|uniref:Sigma 54-interacting transcriptional regulator n=1 Tax=Irregularibacter muris TaxID=1796619 RepID=A0AAE3HJ38_9FIRM|nr:sigma 54-interacting transcriptional regulator [Irregularibacter muris]MCR1899794.1 sigma 54-interacting transcriptional regulator [Irregularibacter muris]
MILNQIIKLTAEDIMDTDLIKVGTNATLFEVWNEMAIKKRNEALILMSHGDREEVKGIITYSDIGDMIRQKVDLHQSVEKHMRKNVYLFSPQKPVKEARDFMVAKGIGSLPIWDGKKIIGMIDTISLRDTYYKKTEELSQQLRTILDRLHEGVCVIDEDGIVTFWNNSAERVYGVEAEELLGKKLSDYFPTALLDMVIKSGEPVENVTHSPRKDTYVAISAKPLWSEGQLVGAVSSERDITEIIQLSMELEEATNRVEFLEKEYRKITEDQYQLGGIIGKSKKLTEAIILAQQVAKASVNVLITGESGTGKEVFARAIHQESARKGDFIAINCSAIPSNLLESELFGYEGGAFTGALTKGKKGKFQLADQGTIFLDEIGEMPIDMQAKLLRVLQDGMVHPVGGEKSFKVNARIIAATNQNLEKMMEEGTFREDLYYRLNVVSIKLPPLRERREDIPLLIHRFIKEFTKVHQRNILSISPEVLRILTDYEWKGNIRELKNTMERLVVLSTNNHITKELMPEEIIKNIKKRKNNPEGEPQEYDLEKTLRKTEISIIQEVMTLVKGNKKRAAEILNIPRSTLYYKLSQYGIE